jgi:gluconate 2-dehydrogenase subunit 3-like protein
MVIRGLNLTRRRALQGALSAFFVPLGAGLSRGQEGPETDLATFTAFVDVLLPADAHSPAASALGVAEEILEVAAEVPPFERLIALASQWLNQTASVPFHQLNDADQITVVRWMSEADFDQIPRRFYHLTRLSAIEVYYAQTPAIGGLPLNPAPQPLGYPAPWG